MTDKQANSSMTTMTAYEAEQYEAIMYEAELFQAEMNEIDADDDQLINAEN